MTTYEEARWQGRVESELEDHERRIGDTEDHVESLDRKMTALLARISVIVALVTLIASVAGAYLGAHGLGH